MKLYDILPTLKKGEKIIHAPSGLEAWLDDTLTLRSKGGPIYISKYNLEVEWEKVVQYIPFEDALKAFKEGKVIKCKIEKHTYIYSINRLDQGIGLDEIIHGDWWIEELVE